MTVADGVMCVQGMTQIRFCTDGVLLQEMLQDPLLTAYRCASSDGQIVTGRVHGRTLSDTLRYTLPASPAKTLE